MVNGLILRMTVSVLITLTDNKIDWFGDIHVLVKFNCPGSAVSPPLVEI